MRVETIGDATLYLADCRDVIGELVADVVVTDPPYGVFIDYSQAFNDVPDYVAAVVVPVIQHCRLEFGRVAVTSGNKCAWMYPVPDDIGVWFNPAGTGFGKWGFNLAHLILYYGKDPKPKTSASSVTGLHDIADRFAHPCSKPIPFMRWLVNKASLPDETVLDPFMG